MRTHFRKLIAAAGAALLTAITAFPAAAVTVSPIVVDLKASGRQMSTVVTVSNNFSTPLPVEMTVQEAVFGDGGLTPSGKVSEDLLVFPPQALIPPNETQSFRVQWIGDPELAQSKHYFVTVSQLPVPLPEGQNAIQVLYAFNVVTSVAPAGGQPAVRIVGTEIEKGQDGKARPVLLLENKSNTYGYLAGGQLRLIQKDPSGRQIFRRSLTGDEIQQEIGYGMVAAGAKRRLLLPLELPSGEGVLEAEFSPQRR